ncbi:uncharacterized protein VP01_2534g1 [Puccinia sorghi]|uniref:Retrotransposon Copia-like N-terminal domain-containing protein n=1 Tax=Puccinia sorghi TaxID=27349 RepID=A0A0L6V5D4_9BASI|nr:uncharacterized protein VP01_2534g1 [Puccinia sorghi]
MDAMDPSISFSQPEPNPPPNLPTSSQPPYAPHIQNFPPTSTSSSSREKLLADGSNYQKWAQRISELASAFIYDTSFFNKPNNLSIHSKKVGFAIILNSVHESLEDELSLHKSCHEIFVFLKAQFLSICQTAQLSMFIVLQDLKPDSFVDTVACGAAMRDMVLDLKDLKVESTSDLILGILLQITLQDGPVKSKFAQPVENIINSSPTATKPPFNNLLKILYSVKRHFYFSNPSKSHALVSNPPNNFNLSVAESPLSPRVGMSQLMPPRPATATYASSQDFDKQNFLIRKSLFCCQVIIPCLKDIPIAILLLTHFHLTARLSYLQSLPRAPAPILIPPGIFPPQSQFTSHQSNSYQAKQSQSKVNQQPAQGEG